MLSGQAISGDAIMRVVTKFFLLSVFISKCAFADKYWSAYELSPGKGGFSHQTATNAIYSLTKGAALVDVKGDKISITWISEINSPNKELVIRGTIHHFNDGSDYVEYDLKNLKLPLGDGYHESLVGKYFSVKISKLCEKDKIIISSPGFVGRVIIIEREKGNCISGIDSE